MQLRSPFGMAPTRDGCRGSRIHAVARTSNKSTGCVPWIYTFQFNIQQTVLSWSLHASGHRVPREVETRDTEEERDRDGSMLCGGKRDEEEQTFTTYNRQPTLKTRPREDQNTRRNLPIHYVRSGKKNPHVLSREPHCRVLTRGRDNKYESSSSSSPS